MSSNQIEVQEIISDDQPPISDDLISNPKQEDDNELDESQGEAPLLQPVASRFISCLRAPCLKKSISITASSSPLGSSTPSTSGTLSPLFGTSPQSNATENSSLSTLCSSFAAIKEVSSSLRPKRQVHFDSSPPESGITHSREMYDRRPIECTRGGSMFDLSLPPRGKCPSYSGEADDESCTAGDDLDSDEEGDKKERMRGFARWAKLKNGGTILGGATLRYAAQSSNKSPEDEQEEADSNTCRLPTHGMIRSFGGLESSIGLSKGENTIEEVKCTSSSTGHKSTLSSPEEQDQDESDAEHAAFRQAVYAALSMSPNATPMPSPSVRTRWECVSSYFDQKLEKAEAANNSTEVDGESNLSDEGQQSPDLPESTVITTEDVDKTPRAHPSIPDEMQTSFPVSLNMPPRAKLSVSSPSTDMSMNGFSSPMSSRCSSTDTWSSSGFPSGDQEIENDEFETEFTKSMTSSFVETPSIMENERLFQRNESSNSDGVSPCETSDSLETDQGGLSSTSMGGNSSHGWMSSGATSPDIGPSDGSSQHNSKETLLLENVPVVEISTSENPFTAKDEDKLNPLRNNKQCSLNNAFSKFPAFLSIHQRRAFSHSAPVSAANSPCVLSGDEGDESDQMTSFKLNSLPLSKSSSCSQQRERSSSGCSSLRKTRKSKKVLTNNQEEGSPIDSGDDVMLTVESKMTSSPLSSSSSSPTRCRNRTVGLRSKSMSAAQCSTIKKSSFSNCSFRSEIEDEGALGGF